MSNNSVKDWGEFHKLGELVALEELLFVGKLLFIMHINLTISSSCYTYRII